MNKTYLVDPKASDNFRDYKALLELFGYAKGRFIIEFPNDWSSIVLNYLDALEIDGVLRTRVIEEFKKKKREMLKPSQNLNECKNWSDLTTSVSSLYSPSPKTIGKENGKADYIFEDVVLTGLDDGATSRATFSESIDNYRELIRPIFEMGTEVFIADRYFQLRRFKEKDEAKNNILQSKSSFQSLSALKSESSINRDLDRKYPINRDSFNFLVEILKDADKSSRTRKVVVFFEEKNFVKNLTENDFCYLLEKDIAVLAEKASLQNVVLEYRIIPQKSFARNHWRLVFCTKCALHFDAGIRFSTKALKNSASWVAPSDLYDLISPYEKFFPD